MELKILGFSSSITALLLAILNGVGNLLDVRALNRASVLVVFAAYLLMAWALASRRVFNAGHVLASAGQRLLVIVLLTAGAWSLAAALGTALHPGVAWPLSAFLCGSAVFSLDERLRGWFGLDEGARLRTLREEILGVAAREAGTDRLTTAIEALVAARHDAPAGLILLRSGTRCTGGGREVDLARPALAALAQDGWITPESIQRRRPSAALADLDALLRELGLAVLVAVPRESPAPNLLLGLAPRRNEWPFTYPEVVRLQHTADLVDNILTRSRLTDQLALRARMEYLGMMSRGLAHDLKNLITPVASFLVHTDGRAAPGTAEAEVHAAASRSVGLMTDYLREALFFSERLAPKLAPVDLSALVRGVREAAALRAARRTVTLVCENAGAGPLIADSVLLQRLLVNLIDNAVDASSAGAAVRLEVEGPVEGRVFFRVIDHGTGMAAATLARIFDPYFTTKEFGEEVRGFGLGLTIAQKIAHLHGGRISVHSRPGSGTTMTVDLPLDPTALPVT